MPYNNPCLLMKSGEDEHEVNHKERNACPDDLLVRALLLLLLLLKGLAVTSECESVEVGCPHPQRASLDL